MKRLIQLLSLTLLAALAVVAQSSATAPAKGAASSTKKGSAAASSTSSDKSIGVIDINSATAEELKQIPGIGDAYAAKIVANRPYRAKNELVDKKVLPAGVYAKVKDHLVAKGGGSTSATSGTAAAKGSSSKTGAKK